MEAIVHCNSIKLKRVVKIIILHVWDHTKEVYEGKIRLCVDIKNDTFSVDKKYKVTFKETQQ